jgi:hypothetical protein
VNLGLLGQIDEPLLSLAISQLTGNSASMKFSVNTFEKVDDNIKGFLNLELR